MLRAFAVVLSVLGLGFGCATKAPVPEPGRVTFGGASEHRVETGETLTAIAARYGTTVEALAAENRLSDKNRLAVGQVLRLPAGIEASPSPSPGPAPRIEPRDPDPPIDCAAHRGAPSGWAVGRSGLSWPVDGVILTRFGQLEGKKHDGLAVGAPRGTPVWAIDEGEVLLVGEEPGYGRVVVVRHSQRRLALYGSLERACTVEGAKIGRGALLGLVGSSSGVASPRLYFELREQERPVDPRPRLP